MKTSADGYPIKPGRRHHERCLFGILLMVAFGACPIMAAPNSPAVYEVRQGDYLGLIANKFGVTVHEIRSANGLSSDVLRIGQVLRLVEPFHRNTQATIDWSAPGKNLGQVLRPFGPYKKKGIIMPSTGTDVACAQGTALSSPAQGIVRHIGHMDGFGILIIIEHGGGYSSVLSPLDPATVAVEAGQALLQGDHIGRTGPPPTRDTPPYLHVELRRNNKAIKPDQLLN